MMQRIRRAALGLLTLALCGLGQGAARAGPVTISAGKVEAAVGKEVQVPITVKGVKDVQGGVSCLSIRLTYDPALLTFKSLDKGAALPNAMLDKSLDEKADPGKLGLGFVCGSKTPGSKEMASVEQDGVLLTVVFTVNEQATAGQKCPLKLDNSRVLDSADPPFELQANTEDGEFTVAGGGFPWLLALLIGLGVLFLLLLLWLLTRRRKEERPPVYAAAPQPGILVSPARPRQAVGAPGAPAGVAMTRFCVSCGKAVNLAPAMMGKKFHCPLCGTPQVAG